VESGSDLNNSRVSEVSDHDMWVERAREKRKRVPSLKAIETAAQEEREFWEM
jgi:ssDNA-binding replication factor A large subunit